MTAARRNLLLLGAVLVSVYGTIVWLSGFFVYGQSHSQRPILLFLGLYAGAFTLYLLAVGNVSRLSRQRIDICLILSVAVLYRGALLFSNPIQEDDFYRYLWDGKVVASGLNPYRFAPLTVLEHTGTDEVLQRYARIPTENADFALILARVNHPAVPTIYPPLAQAVFGLTALLAPGSLLALRLVLLGFDLGICGLVLIMLKHLSLSPLLVLVYAWSPLVIKEAINSAHYDVVPTFFLVLTLWLSLKRKAILAQISLACAVLGKLYPFLLIPLFFFRSWKVQGVRRALGEFAIGVGVVVLGYVPFWDAGPLLWQGTRTFAEHWQTNSLIFPLLHALIEERWVANAVVGVLLGGVILVVPSWYDLREDREFLWGIFIVLGLLFLLSPVGNPWYFLWLLPLLCIFPLRSWLLLSGLLGGYYLSFYFLYRGTPETFRWVVWLEYVPFYLCWLAEWWKSRANQQNA